MGSFVADLTFRAPSLPGWGQTVLGTGFRLGPGGKGSNQAVCAARLGARTGFIGKLGRDAFGELALSTYKKEGIDTSACVVGDLGHTGAAAVILKGGDGGPGTGDGENAIVVDPGSGMLLGIEDVERARPLIEASKVFVTQLELDPAVVEYGLKLAHEAGVTTILNPAPALPLPDEVYGYCDFLTPNEHEAAGLAGMRVDTIDEAAAVAGRLLMRGPRCVIVTLGARGALVKTESLTEHIPAFDAGPVVETTGAGDAFNGALAVGLSEGMDVLAAARFACRVAGISVTRPGTSDSMPRRSEV